MLLTLSIHTHTHTHTHTHSHTHTHKQSRQGHVGVHTSISGTTCMVRALARVRGCTGGARPLFWYVCHVASAHTQTHTRTHTHTHTHTHTYTHTQTIAHTHCSRTHTHRQFSGRLFRAETTWPTCPRRRLHTRLTPYPPTLPTHTLLSLSHTQAPFCALFKSFLRRLFGCVGHVASATLDGEVGGWGRDPKKCTGSIWGMGSSTI